MPFTANRGQIWIQDTSTHAEMREKAKDDESYRERLLKYISHLVTKTMHKNLLDEAAEPFEERVFGSRAFCPFQQPFGKEFEIQKPVDLYDLVLSRNMHSKSHTPTCFKYGNTKKCQAKFPRTLVEETHMELETGLIQLKQDDTWVNGYNPWIMLMLWANHDCKFLFSQIYALAIIHYVMKYISKQEHATHSKLTIAAAVRKGLDDNTTALTGSGTGKEMLFKVYNRLDSRCEIGLPEAISHLCSFPDHYTSVAFVNINTKTLLYHMKHRHHQPQHTPTEPDRPFDRNFDEKSKVFDSEILSTQHGLRLISPFDDYIHHGEYLSEMCLYDYFSLFYKERTMRGIQFDLRHPQANTHCQILHRSNIQVANLLGHLLFIRPDSEDEQVKEDYHCLLAALFVPWSDSRPLNPSTTTSW